MIDLHNHILPGLDDGARDLAESLAMARQLVEEGVTRVTATPHLNPGRNTGVEAPVMSAAVAELQRALRHAQVPLTVLRGTELYLTPDSAVLLEHGVASPLARSISVLVETSLSSKTPPGYLESALFRLQLAGYQPILAHPERYIFVQRNLESIAGLVERGVLLQLTAPSLLGSHGPACRRSAESLLSKGWYTIASSDRHRPGPQPSLQELRRRIKEIGNEDLADLLLFGNPERILKGDPVVPADPMPTKSSGFLNTLFRH